MLFMDRLKEEMENETPQDDKALNVYEDGEEPTEEEFNKMMQALLTEKIFAKPTEEDIQKTVDSNSRIINQLANDMSSVASTFYENLKGKFTSKQMTQMILEIYKIIGGKVHE